MMKIFVAVFAMFAAMVASQASVGSLPSCAIPCVQSGIGATGCAATDVPPHPPFSPQGNPVLFHSFAFRD